jgi:predicted Zn-dependent protease
MWRSFAVPWLAAALLLAPLSVSSCVKNPVTGQRELSLITPEQEARLGREAAEDIVETFGLYEDEALQRYVSQVGMRLAERTERPDWGWQFSVIEEAAVNAFALPGGPVFLTRGIVTHMSSEAELAAVLAHEITHITARHAAKQITRAQLAEVGLGIGGVLSPAVERLSPALRAGTTLLLLRYSRDAEHQADRVGIDYMLRAGYQPDRMLDLFRTLSLVSGREGRLPTWLATHPATEDRFEEIRSLVAQIPEQERAALEVGRDTYLKHVDGMLFGENPQNGYVVEHAFYHPSLRLALTFPEGWSIQNQPEAVIGRSRERDAAVILAHAGDVSPERALRSFLGEDGIRQAGDARVSRDSATAPFVAETEQGRIAGLVRFARLHGRTYQLLGISPEDRFRPNAAALEQALGTFRAIAAGDPPAPPPERIQIVQLPQAMTLVDFHNTYPSSQPIEKIAVLNGLEPTAELPAGMLVKRVLSGSEASP